MSIRRRERRFLLALVAVSAATFGVLRGISDQPPAAAGQTPSAALNPPRSNYEVFARPANGADDVSGWRIPAVAQELGVQPSGARVVFRDQTRIVAAVPSAKGPCLLSRFQDGSGGLNCGGPAGKISVTLGYDGALGLVPDDVKTVMFTMTDGTVDTVPVRGNLWRSPAEAARASFVVDGVPQDIELMPRSSLPRGASVSPTGVVTLTSPAAGG